MRFHGDGTLMKYDEICEVILMMKYDEMVIRWGVLRIGVPKNGSRMGNPNRKWMIWWYPNFRKLPNETSW